MISEIITQDIIYKYILFICKYIDQSARLTLQDFL